ncbi:MAG TPA: hypothetical protein VM557_02100, partial [Thermoanaerobaculia bacterium]|nr:hypothetical protein [Thermoanaerobaculia bacterium]
MKRSILASLLLLVPAVLFAGSYIVPSDRELIESADAIVIGDVLASYSYYGEGGKIFTDTILRVSESVRGVNPSEVRITEEGGVVGDRAVFVSTTPVYVPGQRVLAMLKQDGSRLTT